MSIVNSDDGAGAVKVQVQSAIARILQATHRSKDSRRQLGRQQQSNCFMAVRFTGYGLVSELLTGCPQVKINHVSVKYFLKVQDVFLA